tara:strand:- start:200 stop:757 length:558 start_codon:yes stop_codon:yes gene_type:complete
MTSKIDFINKIIINKNKSWVYEFKKNIFFKILGNDIFIKQKLRVPPQLTNKPWNFNENDNMSQHELESKLLNYIKSNNLLNNGFFKTNAHLEKLFDIKPSQYEIKYLSNFIGKIYNQNLNLKYINFSFKNLDKINTLYKKEIYNEILELIKCSYKISEKINNSAIIDIWKVNIIPYIISLLILKI